jgi:hypothetical protein
MKNRNSRMREIAFHTLFCKVSMVSILLTMQKKYTSENDPLQAQITMREFQFFESIIEKSPYTIQTTKYWVSKYIGYSRTASPEKKRENLGKCDNLNLKEKSPILSDNREKIFQT